MPAAATNQPGKPQAPAVVRSRALPGLRGLLRPIPGRRGREDGMSTGEAGGAYKNGATGG